MAFIREYAAQGDPFKFGGLFKKLGRKIGGGILGRVAGFVPGGSVVTGALGALRGRRRAAPAPVCPACPVCVEPGSPHRMQGFIIDEYDEEEEEVSPWRRAYGMDEGDPKRGPRRKQAAAGGKAKANRKREVRRARKRRGPGRVERGLSAVGRGLSGVGRNLPGVIGLASRFLPGAGGEEDLAALVPGGLPAGPGGAGPPLMRGGRVHQARYTKDGRLTYRKRPAMQATNTKALNRSVRRLEAFQNVVKKVYKAMPGLRPHGGGSARRGRGHKAGCKCVACR